MCRWKAFNIILTDSSFRKKFSKKYLKRQPNSLDLHAIFKKYPNYYEEVFKSTWIENLANVYIVGESELLHLLPAKCAKSFLIAAIKNYVPFIGFYDNPMFSSVLVENAD
jgi:hypothetical protein